jgi:hypothetical protein
MGSIVRVAAYTAMTVIGILGLKKEGVIEFDTKKVFDLFR